MGNINILIIINVDADISRTFISKIFPNPTNSNIDFDFNTPVSGLLNYVVRDYTGKMVLNNNTQVESGKTQIKLNVKELPKGIYFLELYFEKTDFISINKLFKD